MIYLLLAIGAFVLFVWAGRRARPFLAKRELRIASGTLAALSLAGGGFAALRGAYVVGAALVGVGLVLAVTARRGTTAALPRTDTAELAEAREILGVAANATREDIQAAYARLIRAVHPDAGGSSGLAARLNAARDALLGKK